MIINAYKPLKLGTYKTRLKSWKWCESANGSRGITFEIIVTADPDRRRIETTSIYGEHLRAFFACLALLTDQEFADFREMTALWEQQDIVLEYAAKGRYKNWITGREEEYYNEIADEDAENE